MTGGTRDCTAWRGPAWQRSFPQTIGIAATFDEALLAQDADAIGTEFRAKYNISRGKDGSSVQYKGLTVWSPNINIFRDPRWGRGQETYGEGSLLDFPDGRGLRQKFAGRQS